VLIRSRIRLKDQPDATAPVLEACFPKSPCPAIELRYEVENTGTTSIALWHSGFWPNHRVRLLDARGADAPLTKEGDLRRAAFSPRGPRDKNIEWPIAPGKVDESEGPIELFSLSPIFGVPALPGRYTVEVDYEEDIAFSSNVLTLWIVPPGTLAELDRLNSWYPDECDVYERPAAYPGRKASGETGGFVTSSKEALAKRGVTVSWDPAAHRYHVTEVH
jgi:hypothetical protein